jgi:C4-dicarboxylate-specific signal transduction histidine kinase
LIERLRVLHVEDVDDDAALVANELRRGGWQPRVKRVEDAAAMRDALRDDHWDLVISDFSLPSFDAPSALAVLHEARVDLPFIIVSGTITEEVAVSAMKAGAHDFVTKANLRRLVPAIQRELREAESRRERRRSDALRERAEARFRSLVESMEGIVLTLDSHLRIDGVYGRGVGDGRLDERDYLGKRLRALLGSGEGVPGDAECARALAGEQVTHEWVRATATGVKYLQLVLSPIVLDDGLVHGLVGVMRNVGDQKELQAKLVQSDRLAAIGALAAGVGHEINNPLAAMLANLDAVSSELARVEREADGCGGHGAVARAKEGLEDARGAGERVRQVARDLRVMSRTPDETRAPVQVRRALESAARLALNEIRPRARLVCDFVAHEPPVLASESRLGQVFVNLLVNAAQAIPPGDPSHHEVRMRTRVGAGGRTVIIEIADTGSGIPEALVPRLFTPFVTSKPEGQGTGLGLSICQRIVHEYGGSISFESAPGRGTTFRVELPAAPAGVHVEPAPAPARPAPAPAAVAKGRNGRRRGRVLVVDDEAILQRAIKRSLGVAHDVVAVGSGREAIDAVRAGPAFDVILSDLMMPEMTGAELHTALAAFAPEQAERMVFLTGGACCPVLRDFVEGTSHPMVEKPFDPRRLLELVDERVAES